MSESLPPIVAPREKLFHYCTILYERMESEATAEVLPAIVDGDGAAVLVWRGRLIATCDDLGIPRGSYQRVVRALRNSQCVEQSERGFRGVSLSVFTLHHPPTPEVQADLKDSPAPLTTAPSLDRLSAEVRDVQRQLGGINIPEALIEVERRLDVITAQLQALLQQQQQNNSNNNEGEKTA